MQKHGLGLVMVLLLLFGFIFSLLALKQNTCFELELIVVYVAGVTFLVCSVISLKDGNCRRKFNQSGI